MKIRENSSDQEIVRIVLSSIRDVITDKEASVSDKVISGLSAISALGSVQNQQYRTAIIRKVAAITKK